MSTEEIRRIAVLSRTPDTFENEAQAAAAWLVRLDADTSATTLALWVRWLSEDARRHVAYARVESSWRQMDCLRSMQPLDGTVNVDLLDTFPGVRPGSRLRRGQWPDPDP